MGPPGHFGVAFAAKSTKPAAQLWVFLIASIVLELLLFSGGVVLYVKSKKHSQALPQLKQ
jgi:hypothetical protein